MMIYTRKFPSLDMDTIKTKVIRESIDASIGMDVSYQEMMDKFYEPRTKLIQRSIHFPAVNTIDQWDEIVNGFTCVAKVDYINPCLSIVWVNVESPNDKKTTGNGGSVFTIANQYYPVKLHIADDIMASVVFNIHLGIHKIERCLFEYTCKHTGHVFVPYTVEFCV
jgi:hypothetical protein